MGAEQKCNSQFQFLLFAQSPCWIALISLPYRLFSHCSLRKGLRSDDVETSLLFTIIAEL